MNYYSHTGLEVGRARRARLSAEGIQQTETGGLGETALPSIYSRSLKFVRSLVCFGVSVFAAEVAIADTDRPNVVLIMCDDLNDYIEPLGGHPQAYTPNLTRLARSNR